MDKRQPYPPDLSNAQWAQVGRFIPAPKPGGRPAKYDRREIANALLYVARTGCQWRALPHDFPPWTTVYWYFRTWKKDGTLNRLMDQMRGDLRAAEGRHRQPSAAIIDSPSVKTTERVPHGIEAFRKVNGRKRQILVDTLGLILVVVHSAEIQDPDGAKRVVEAIRGRFRRLKRVGADGISKRVVDWVASWRPAKPIRLEVVERTEPGFQVLPRRWVVERTVAGLERCRRLSQDDEGTTRSSEAFVKRAMIHLMTRRLVKRLGL